MNNRRHVKFFKVIAIKYSILGLDPDMSRSQKVPRQPGGATTVPQ
jgi:hypothetical protein